MLGGDLMNKFKNGQKKYYITILLIIFIIGICGVRSFNGNSNWSFIFENMMWLPFELVLTIFSINKILELNEEKRNYEKFKYIAGEKNRYLIKAIKKNTVHIAINCQSHDENRDEIELYNKIIKNPKKYFNDELFSTSRKYLISDSSGRIQTKNYNYFGIVYTHCNKLDQRLEKYIKQFYFYFDDKLFKQISDFKTSNSGFGRLDAPPVGLNFNKNNIASEGYNCLQKEALDYIAETEKIIKLLEKY